MLIGLLVSWQVLANINDEGEKKEDLVLRGQFDFYVIHSKKPVLVSFEADW